MSRVWTLATLSTVQTVTTVHAVHNVLFLQYDSPVSKSWKKHFLKEKNWKRLPSHTALVPWSIGWLWVCRKWLNTQKIAIGYIFSLSRQSFAQKHPCLVINKNWFTCIVKRIANPTFISRIFVFELILTHNRVWVLLWLCSHFLIMWLRLIEIGPTEVVEKGKCYLNLWTIRHWQ